MKIPEGNYILIEDYCRKHKMPRETVRQRVLNGKLPHLRVKNSLGITKFILIDLSTD